MKIAIFAPNENVYSETFIKAHKEQLKGDIKFLYGDWIPKFEEKKGSLETYYNRQFKAKLEKLLPFFIYKNIKINYLKNYLKKEKIDVVLAEYGVSGAKNFDVIEKLNIPLVIHFHGFDAAHYKTIEKYGELYKKMFDYASAIIVVSEKMKNDVIKLGCPIDKIQYITYEPNKKFFKNEPNYNSNIISAVGRFADKKAPYYTILAFKKVYEKNKNLKLVMGGDGPLFDTCQNLVKYLGLSHAIEFKGVLNQKEVVELFNKSFCFVQHSIIALNGDSEGTPVAVLEASASALPIVSTKHAGIPDVVKHGHTGFLVNEGNVDEMANYILKLAKDRDLAKQMGEKGRNRVQEKYTSHIDKIDKIIEKAYNDAKY